MYLSRQRFIRNFHKNPAWPTLLLLLVTAASVTSWLIHTTRPDTLPIIMVGIVGVVTTITSAIALIYPQRRHLLLIWLTLTGILLLRALKLTHPGYAVLLTTAIISLELSTRP